MIGTHFAGTTLPRQLLTENIETRLLVTPTQIFIINEMIGMHLPGDIAKAIDTITNDSMHLPGDIAKGNSWPKILKTRLLSMIDGKFW